MVVVFPVPGPPVNTVVSCASAISAAARCSADPVRSDFAFDAYFYAGGVSPGYDVNRNGGFGVRCLLN